MNRTVEGLDAPMFGTDNAGGVASVLDWLQRHNHHDVAFVGGPSTISTGAERLAAYRAGREAHGISLDESLIDTGDFLPGGAEQAMHRILDRDTHPTAVFGANGPTTMGVVRAVRDRLGPDWATKIAIVSFDDLDWFQFASPPISAVRNDATTIGRLGVRGLVDLIQGRPTESTRVATSFTDRLVPADA
jgi:LacI family transcriptional regulator